MMFNDQNFMGLKPLMSFGLEPAKFEVEDDLLKDFGNSLLDQHHNFSNLSIP
jgi:hypothetical protein